MGEDTGHSGTGRPVLPHVSRRSAVTTLLGLGVVGTVSGSASAEPQLNGGRYIENDGDAIEFTGPAEWNDEGAYENDSNGVASVIAGGEDNLIEADYVDNLASVIAGGTSNKIEGDYAAIAGGKENRAIGWGSTVGGGIGNQAFSPPGYDFSADSEDNERRPTSGEEGATVSGGIDNEARRSGATVGGGFNNRAESTGTVGGGVENKAASGATVGGGDGNKAEGDTSTIAGGGNNEVTGTYATVSGGVNNDATKPLSTVGGGNRNRASGELATVSGGKNNEASGGRATVIGGAGNTADGDYSVAAGREALTDGHDGAVVFGDSTWESIEAENDNELRAQMPAYAPFFSPTGLQRGTQLDEGPDPQTVLDDVRDLNVSFWESTTLTGERTRHLGPAPTEFREVFDLGDDDDSITTVDADGVLFAAVQGLIERLERVNSELQERLDEKEERLDELEKRIEELGKRPPRNE